ncbi:unnamed protein product [Sphagnum compactum]
MASGTVQLNSFLWNTRLGKHVKAGEGEKTMELLLPNAARRNDSPKDARSVFNKMATPNVATWNAVLRGCAMHRHGLLDEFGLCYFQSMGPVYSTSATIELHASTFDLLGHAGHLYKAGDLVKTVICGYTVTATVLESLKLVGTAITE